MKKLSDVVDYDKTHLEKREKLRNLLEAEEEALLEELAAKRVLEECNYCTEQTNRFASYNEEMEAAKLQECLKALEREKIAKGMKCTRTDNIELRETHKMQMYEKKCIEMEEQERENMWHQVLLNDVRRKEQIERQEASRKYQEMLQRRRTYDEQIAISNRERKDTLNEEREKEKARLEKIRMKMEQDYYDDMTRRREKQMANKANYMEGHKLKVQRQWQEKCRERELDNNTIRTALDALSTERLRKRNAILNWRKEEKIFADYFNIERKAAEELEKESDNVLMEWMLREASKAEETNKQEETKRRIRKENAIEEYQKHIDELKLKAENERRVRTEKMRRVSASARKEIQRKLDCT
ncbi:hypothetical protein ACJJTC_004274 [Scirpophaga incertulas]